ncbi:MAG: cyclic pyranopterin monophosphate synthase MoaC [Planctomycetota bacterium]|nr:MAG: cyclic pyranopterin monophosphate synthase MoaC [Planctomycetota bacterium]
MREPGEWTHLDADQRARMVDVGSKAATVREAEAEALVLYPDDAYARILSGSLPKGGIVEPARLAGIMAAKRASEWIPLCHPLPLDAVEVAVDPLSDGRPGLRVRCCARATARTGVEMEAMVGAAAAALTLYDMTKSLARGARIEGLRLLRKSGGKSGAWQAQ